MVKYQEEIIKLKNRANKWKKKYYDLQQEQDDYWANKLSLSVIKIGMIFTGGIALGRYIR